MTSIFLDTALLGMPNYAVDAETGQEIIDRIIHFADISSPEIPIDLILLPDAEDKLWSQNAGPDYDQIEAFLSIMELTHIYSTQDLWKRYLLIFEQCERGENIGIVDVESFSDFVSSPELPDVTPAQLRHESQRTFVTAAAWKSNEPTIRVGSAFYGDCPSEFSISAEIHSVNQNRLSASQTLPLAVNATVPVVSNLHELISSDTADDLWLHAETAHDIHFAITIGALALLRAAGQQCDSTQLERFTIGSKFIESLQSVECWQSGRFSSTARELCSQIVAKRCNRQISRFSLKEQKIRTFDQGKAWRTHLTAGKQALRLMHWTTPSGIEFANIDVKGGEFIEIGSYPPAADYEYSDYF